MTGKRSLRLRQLLLAIITIAAALLISFVGFTYLFERHVERRFASELEVRLQNIAAGLVFGGDNKLHMSAAAVDPQFDVPLSGFYWQVTDLKSGQVLRSRSLWDSDLPKQGNKENKQFFVVSRNITLSEKDDGRLVLIEVALASEIIAAARNEFARDLSRYLLLLGLVLFGLTALQIEIGLWPLKKLRRDVEKLTNAVNARMDDGYPKEVEPLTHTINRLLEARMHTVEQAEKRAADLAHGLKSPLAALRNQAVRLETAGDTFQARILRDLSISFERQINRELTRARAENAAQKGAVYCQVATLINPLVRVLKSTAFGEKLKWQVNVPVDAIMPLDASDLAEALGPLMENAARHAQGIVRIDFSDDELKIEDDGPGMSEEQCRNALQRGVRYDERQSSTGLGLSIAQDVLMPYGYELAFGQSDLGGLKVIIRQVNKPPR